MDFQVLYVSSMLINGLQFLSCTEADQDEKIGKQQYAAIDAAAEKMKSEIAKPQANKSVLATAVKTLEGFKNIASIAGSIEKISQYLIHLIS
jgi:hypothetical protein